MAVSSTAITPPDSVCKTEDAMFGANLDLTRIDDDQATFATIAASRASTSEIYAQLVRDQLDAAVQGRSIAGFVAMLATIIKRLDYPDPAKPGAPGSIDEEKLVAALHVLSGSLNKLGNGLATPVVAELLSFDRWSQRSPRITEAYVQFLSVLVSSSPKWWPEVARKVVAQFADPDRDLGPQHAVLRRIVAIVPTSSAGLGDVFTANFPHQSSSSRELASYTANLLKALDYAPEQLAAVWQLVVQKLITLDVECEDAEQALKRRLQVSDSDSDLDSDSGSDPDSDPDSVSDEDSELDSYSDSDAASDEDSELDDADDLRDAAGKRPRSGEDGDETLIDHKRQKVDDEGETTGQSKGHSDAQINGHSDAQINGRINAQTEAQPHEERIISKHIHHPSSDGDDSAEARGDGQGRDQHKTERHTADDFADGEEVTNLELQMLDARAEPMAAKVDAVLALLLEHLSAKFTPSAVKSGAATPLFKTLLAVFKEVVLPTAQLQAVQFIWFHITHAHPDLLASFISVLLETAMSSSTSYDQRARAMQYVASFVARAKGLTRPQIVFVVGFLADWVQRYIKEREQEVEESLSMARFRMFYAAVQALFYIFVFRHNMLRITDEDDRVAKAGAAPAPPASAPRAWVANLDKLFPQVINTRFNPLQYCQPEVVAMFARIAQHEEVASCYSIIERNRWGSFRAKSDDPPAGRTGASNGLFASNRDNKLYDSFLPFQPLRLKKSKRFFVDTFEKWSEVDLSDSDTDREHDMEYSSDSDY